MATLPPVVSLQFCLLLACLVTESSLIMLQMVSSLDLIQPVHESSSSGLFVLDDSWKVTLDIFMLAMVWYVQFRRELIWTHFDDDEYIEM